MGCEGEARRAHRLGLEMNFPGKSAVTSPHTTEGSTSICSHACSLLGKHIVAGKQNFQSSTHFCLQVIEALHMKSHGLDSLSQMAYEKYLQPLQCCQVCIWQVVWDHVEGQQDTVKGVPVHLTDDCCRQAALCFTR